jgi:periplasmic protein TonB
LPFISLQIEIKPFMNKGKITCDVLKEIRKQIASENKIEYHTHDCTFEGECRGTCPACESEVQYLENEIVKRKYLGKAVVVAGLSVGLLGTFTSCTIKEKEKEKNASNNTDEFITVGDISESDSTINETPSDTFHPKCESYNKNFTLGSLEGDVVQVTKTPFLDYPTDTLYEINMIEEEIDTKDEIIPPLGGITESMPEFPGGSNAFIEYLNNELHYPENCIRDSISGVVIVEFVIEENGKITNAKVTKSVDPDLDKEALRFVENFPDWIWKTRSGKKARFTYTLPIKFSLE